MKEINENQEDELLDIDFFEVRKIDNSEIDQMENDLNSNETILCEECEYSLIVGLEFKSANFNYCPDCAMENLLIKAMTTYRKMTNKNKGRDKK